MLQLSENKRSKVKRIIHIFSNSIVVSNKSNDRDDFVYTYTNNL